jgi:hypothetical protein
MRSNMAMEIAVTASHISVIYCVLNGAAFDILIAIKVGDKQHLFLHGGLM